jgi:NAD(P)-dependent dehydrogenase (short-subunit alcohol dehydrogenase family)
MSGLKDLAGRTAVVTGGASGIGKGMARRLKAQGMQVVIADVERGALDHAAGEIGAVGVLTDVASLDSVQALAEEVRRRFGTAHLVCNNAGVGSTALLSDMSESDWDWILGVNLRGVIHGVKAFLPMLLANPDGGWIVNTASMAGFSVLPTLGGYTTSKFAVMGFSETLAAELEADGAKVGVSILCPGPVRSNIKASSRNRPAALAGGALADSDLENDAAAAQMRWLDPDQVGDIVVRAVRRGHLYALTHPEMAAQVVERHRRIEAAFEAAALQEA